METPREAASSSSSPAGSSSRTKESVRRRVRELQRLVPGGRELPADQLLMHTADYIHQLRLRVLVLRALSELYLP